MLALWILLGLAVQGNSQCYSSGCVGAGGGGGGAGFGGVGGGAGFGGTGGGAGGYEMPYVQVMQQPIPQYLTSRQIPQQPQPSDYYYKVMNTYSQPPIEVSPSTTKDIVTVSLPTKSAEYDDYEKKRTELKPIPVDETATVYENPIKPSETYIREMAYRPYPQQPMPYRPHPFPPAGCAVMPPQYYRPAPYMPRGYMMPHAPPPGYPVAPSFRPQQTLPSPLQQPRYQPPLNDCCGRCSAVCGPHGRRIFAKSAKTFPLKESNRTVEVDETDLNDTRCTSKKLKEIMEKTSYRTPSVAKRLIQRTAEKDLGGFFSVFCSKDDFTYVSRSETYCQTENNGILCYAFQHA